MERPMGASLLNLNAYVLNPTRRYVSGYCKVALRDTGDKTVRGTCMCEAVVKFEKIKGQDARLLPPLVAAIPIDESIDIRL